MAQSLEHWSRNSLRVNWTYLANNWLQTQTLANGVVTTETDNDQGQTLDQKTTLGGATLADFGVPTQGGYDGAGDLLGVNASLPAGPSGDTGSTSYAYDLRGQTLSEQSSRLGGYTDAYAYDGGTTTGPGNPTAFLGSSRAYTADNQLAGTGFAYDGDGSPTTYRGASLAFDPESRMTADGSVQANGYTGDGLRAWTQAGGARTYFLYDSDEQPVCELSATGAVTATDTFGADGLLSRHLSSGGSVFYACDLSGNVALRLTSTGGVASADVTSAFGTRTTTDTTGDPFAFAGQWGGDTDAATGLTLLTHRFYDAGTGRFLTRDPMGYDGGINLYAYCDNDPINWIDNEGFAARLLGSARNFGLSGGINLSGTIGNRGLGTPTVTGTVTASSGGVSAGLTGTLSHGKITGHYHITIGSTGSTGSAGSKSPVTNTANPIPLPPNPGQPGSPGEPGNPASPTKPGGPNGPGGPGHTPTGGNSKGTTIRG